MRWLPLCALAFIVAPSTALPAWSWDTLQTYVHCANFSGEWNDQALAVLAQQPFVVFEKYHKVLIPTHGCFDYTEPHIKVVLNTRTPPSSLRTIYTGCGLEPIAARFAYLLTRGFAGVRGAGGRPGRGQDHRELPQSQAAEPTD